MIYALGFVLTILLLWVTLRGLRCLMLKNQPSHYGNCQWVRSLDQKNRLACIAWHGKEYLVILGDSYGFVVDRSEVIEDNAV